MFCAGTLNISWLLDGSTFKNNVVNDVQANDKQITEKQHKTINFRNSIFLNKKMNNNKTGSKIAFLRKRQEIKTNKNRIIQNLLLEHLSLS